MAEETDEETFARAARAQEYAMRIVDFHRLAGDERARWYQEIVREALQVPDADPVDWRQLDRRASERDLREEWADLVGEYLRALNGS